MPYDARPTSEGGNRGIDERFSRAAPPKQFRVIGVDTFDGGDWHEGDFPTKLAALAHATQRSGTMTKMHVYDDKGHHIDDFGTF